jgi:hypothetical protein
LRYTKRLLRHISIKSEGKKKGEKRSLLQQKKGKKSLCSKCGGEGKFYRNATASKPLFPTVRKKEEESPLFCEGVKRRRKKKRKEKKNR